MRDKNKLNRFRLSTSPGGSVTCPRCHGERWFPKHHKRKACEQCAGSGTVRVSIEPTETAAQGEEG